MSLRKHIVSSVILCLIAAILSSCIPTPRKLRAPTNEEIKQFIEHKKLKPSEVLATKNIGDSAVILFETKKEIGSCNFSVDNEGNWPSSCPKSPNNSNNTPVSISGSATGTPYVCVDITNKTLLEKAHQVIVTYEDGYIAKEMVEGKKGHILAREGVKNAKILCESVVIIDKTSKALFKWPS